MSEKSHKLDAITLAMINRRMNKVIDQLRSIGEKYTSIGMDDVGEVIEDIIYELDQPIMTETDIDYLEKMLDERRQF